MCAGFQHQRLLVTMEIGWMLRLVASQVNVAAVRAGQRTWGREAAMAFVGFSCALALLSASLEHLHSPLSAHGLIGD